MGENIKQDDKKYIAGTYSRADILIDNGIGESCHDSLGKDYIDFSSGIGVNSLGYCDPMWVEAVKAQLDRLTHASNLYYTAPQVALAKALCQRTGMKKVFFANSGAEANEGAIKTARKYSSDKYGDNRYEIITLVNSFHGRTIATLSATGQDSFHQHFGPFVAGFLYANPNDLASVKSLASDKTAAIMVECIQGEGGVTVLDKDFLCGIAAICQQQDILLVVDEVQTGIGRTGSFLACQQYGVTPDIVTLAKGLGGGLPIGAVLMGEKVEYTLGFGDHGTTFGGNPVVAAGALAVMDRLDDSMLNEITQKGVHLLAGLKTLPQITAVTGAGLMLGLQLKEGLIAGEIVKLALKKGLIVLTAKNKVRLLPPLNISYDQLDIGIEILKETLEEAAL